MSPPGPLLRLAGLTAGYARVVVGPVSLTQWRGEVLGLTGANGCGKSTLLAAISGAARVFDGHIERAPGLRVAVQPQRPVRIPGLPVTGRDLLRAAGLKPGRAPAALRPLLATRAERLSGGQYQLLAVHVALASDADLILLDEPGNNLDATHTALLCAWLEAATAAGRGVLLVSHGDSALASVCNRVITIGA